MNFVPNKTNLGLFLGVPSACKEFKHCQALLTIKLERDQSGFPKGKRHVRHHKLVALSPVLSSSPSHLLCLPCALVRLELGVHKVFPVQKLSRAGAEGGNHTEHPPVLAAPAG